tara:strand:+ start:1343 stop:1546 length:204 start_codon:yes stop_codon:yes gene_type:complete
MFDDLIIFMKSNSLNRTSTIEMTPQCKVDVDVLKRRIFLKKKKEKIQNRVILASAIVSLGVISYFVG